MNMQIKLTALTILLSALSFTGMTQSNPLQYLITGTYTGGKSEDIYVFEFNSKNGSYREVSHVKTSNPSFLAVKKKKVKALSMP